MLKNGLFFLVLVSLCAADVEFPPEYNNCSESGSCNDRIASSFKIASEALARNEPLDMRNIDPCDDCNISSLHTIGLCESTLIKICADNNYPEGMYYYICLFFDEIHMDCLGCKAKDKQGVYQRGRYSATWKNQEVAVRFKKDRWNGPNITVLEFKVTSEPNPDLIDGVCQVPETDDWLNTCNDAKKTGGFPLLFATACETYYSDIVNNKKSDFDSLAPTMTCNKDDIELK